MEVENATWRLFVDGASRNNPGPAGIGVYLIKDDAVYVKDGWYIGEKTNNQAEYIALLAGISRAKQYMQPYEHIAIFSDSELIVKQLQGKYKVKNVLLRPLYQRVKTMLSGMSYTIQHVMRAENSVADRLANDGIDQNISLPEDIAQHVS